MEELVRIIVQGCGGAGFSCIEPALFRLCMLNRGLIPFLLYSTCVSHQAHGEPKTETAVAILNYLHDNVACMQCHQGRVSGLVYSRQTLETVIRATGGSCMRILFQSKFRDAAVDIAAALAADLQRLPKERTDRALAGAVADRLVSLGVISADGSLQKYRRLTSGGVSDTSRPKPKGFRRLVVIEVCPLGDPVHSKRIGRIMQKCGECTDAVYRPPLHLTLSSCRVKCAGVLWNVAAPVHTISPQYISGFSEYWLDLIVRHGMQLDPWKIMSHEIEAFLSRCNMLRPISVGI
jgi:hypothetical protein